MVQNGAVEFEDLGPGYEGEDVEFEEGFDPTEGKGSLVPFSADPGALKVSLGGGQNEGGGRDDSFSGIIRNEQKFDFSIIFSYTRDYVPDSHSGKMIVQQGSSMGMWLMNCRALRRKERLEGFEQRAIDWKKRMGSKADREAQLDLVDQRLAKWARANMSQARIRVDRLMYGLDFIDGPECDRHGGEVDPDGCIHDKYLYDWFQADRDMREAVTEAIEKLSTEGLQVFFAQMEAHKLLREEMEDRAQHLPTADLTDWWRGMTEGDATQAHLLLGAPWIVLESAIFAMENQGKNNPHKLHLEKMQAGMITQNASRRNSPWNRSPASYGGQQALPAGQPAQTGAP